MKVMACALGVLGVVKLLKPSSSQPCGIADSFYQIPTQTFLTGYPVLDFFSFSMSLSFYDSYSTSNTKALLQHYSFNIVQLELLLMPLQLRQTASGLCTLADQ